MRGAVNLLSLAFMIEIHLLASVTDVAIIHRGGVAITGSHGGYFPAAVASRAGLRAVVFNDAGGGGGVVGLSALDEVGMAAAAVDCMTCHIGSATDAAENGIISVVNETAAALGVEIGQHMSDASSVLLRACPPAATLPHVPETSRIVDVGKLKVHLLDSASLVGDMHRDQVLVTGSHGALIGNDPARSLKTAARFVAFNDAGFGKDKVGISRLWPLAGRGIAAVTVSHKSAPIGDAAAALDTGRVSAVNAPAAALGAKVGMGLGAFLSVMSPAA